MARPSLIKRIYLNYLAKPANERVLFSAIANGSVARIVEIGIGDCSRALRLIGLGSQCRGEPIAYCGLDFFESAPHGRTVVRLKDAFLKLQRSRATVKLVPGDPIVTLPKCANALTKTDLLLFGHELEWDSFEPMWMYVPRMMAAEGLVWRQHADGRFERVQLSDVRRLAERAAELRRKSA